MHKNKFFEMVERRWAAGARVCVGLDPDIRKIPQDILNSKKTSSPLLEINKKTIEATKDLALCYKLNRAFYPGPAGLEAMRNTVAHIRNIATDVPSIDDAKYGDIGNTNYGYVEEAFGYLQCDAVTVHNYMGLEAMEPFLAQKDKGIFVLCRTSDEGSEEFQDLIVDTGRGFMPLYQEVAHRVVCHWNYNHNCGLVVGAMVPDELVEVRKIAKTMPILIPDFGSQGGDVHDAMHAGLGRHGGTVLPSSSSGIMFAHDPKAAVQKLTDEINAVLEKVPA
ncbi:MAG TPA: orotidine-5'-phosphate decarboxylase [Candidatus Paceibacterota bacterium]|nr:orotidine-5'-phosphate decarboxylase [Candidatus Paceibacterota bacterium]